MDDKSCPRCRDTGWVIDPQSGKRTAVRCPCLTERRAELLLERSKIPLRYHNCSFTNYESHHPSQGAALKLARKFVEKFDPESSLGLLLIGPCGVGKTHLAVGLLCEVMKTRGASGLFYDFRELLRDIQATFSPDSDLRESDILAPVFESQVLVLDELGAQRSSAWVEDTVFYIINNRYNRKKVTVFTSNYLDSDEDETEKPSEFKKENLFKKDETLADRIGIRLRSRIYEMCKVVLIDGPDYRRKHKQAGYRF